MQLLNRFYKVHEARLYLPQKPNEVVSSILYMRPLPEEIAQ